ncbi:hypothetical protein C9927_03680 [Pseudidiomarina aestuarii]|uniref:DUF1414 domain-containing protein n=1 Tax=Pseudidiomarina aestuarii TaxID=624146 RepID=A0A2T4D4D3_9GAMM|nr:hypothetical protein C9927_03680 [Pseudidiomarina aestuarii]PTB88794.1 hypothetical protein C9928_05550 [Pseudidiomarina aestuarii]
MPIVSKYSAETQQQQLEDVLAALANAPADLALMTLGNAVSNVIDQHYSSAQAVQIAEQFGKVLLQSMQKRA